MQPLGVESLPELCVVVSPHLDDAVFSMGGWLLAHGQRLRVVTLCAGEPSAGSLSSWDRRCGFASGAEAVQRRRAEDHAACRLIGVEPVHLSFADFPYTGLKTTDAVAEALRGALAGARKVFVPLGIGAHPDHVVARDAGLQVAVEAAVELSLYADAPYASARGFFRQDVEREPSFKWAIAMKAVSDAGFVLGPASVDTLEPAVFDQKVEVASRYASQLPGLRLHYPHLTDPGGPLGNECWWPCRRAAVERAS
jgi:LmbE family N-acetylglucosaminyl deacetylase